MHSRSSYGFEDIVHGMRFADMFLDPQDGHPRIDVGRLDLYEPA